MVMHLWQPAKTFGGGGLSFQVTLEMSHQTIQMPGQRLILAETWCTAWTWHPLFFSSSMEQIEKGLFVIQGKEERKRNCLEDVLVLAGREQGGHVVYEHLICLNRVPTNGVAWLLTLVLPSLSPDRTVFKAVPELHFIFLIVPSYMSLGKVC